jgi:hypothetical protein
MVSSSQKTRRKGAPQCWRSNMILKQIASLCTSTLFNAIQKQPVSNTLLQTVIYKLSDTNLPYIKYRKDVFVVLYGMSIQHIRPGTMPIIVAFVNMIFQYEKLKRNEFVFVTYLPCSHRTFHIRPRKHLFYIWPVRLFNKRVTNWLFLYWPWYRFSVSSIGPWHYGPRGQYC